MNITMNRQLFFTFLSLLLSTVAFSQFRIGMIPRVSPDVDVSFRIGYTDIGIHYNSPSVKERKIWGDLVPYDRVWRAGANEATSMDFSHEMKIAGKAIPKGSYSFFVIPKEQEPWVVVFNKAAKQWGAFGYDSAKDYLRLEVEPEIVPQFAERLNYEIIPTEYGKAELVLRWEYLRLALDVEVEIVAHLINTIDSVAVSTKDEFKWAIYYQGAEYLLNNNQRPELALKWADTSLQRKVYSNTYWVKAQLLAQLDRKKEAIATLDELLALARTTDKKTIYSDKKNEIDEAYAKWKN